MRPSNLAAAAVSCLLACLPGAALAAKVVRVDIDGLDGPMQHNVRLALSLVDALDKEISPRRLAYLLRVAESEAKTALEPFGHYDAAITARYTTVGEAAIAVTYTIVPGEPVRVRHADVRITGAGSEDAALQRSLAGFVPGSGDVFNHAGYEASKLRVSRALSERGYFDAALGTHRVEINRTQRSADIDLAWDSGARYRMGEVRFVQMPRAIIDASILHNLPHWHTGDLWQQPFLDQFRQQLARLDYFSQIEIEPLPAEAVEQHVPLAVRLTAAKRSIYSAGLSFGTDSGLGLRLGLQRRYLNPRGLKFLTQLDLTRKRKTLTAQYRVPVFAWRSGWYSLGIQGDDEQTDYIDTRRGELSVSRSAEYSPQLNLAAAVHALRERWAYDIDTTTDGRALYRHASYSYPSLRIEYSQLDERLYPRRGISGWAVLRTGIDGALSDATFLQVNARASVFLGLGETSRIILRGEIGHTFTNALNDMPPSLRFYAGGDRSIRGYEWREVGPRLVRFAVDDNGAVRQLDSWALGARNMLTASVELEHYFRNDWGMALFVDGGSAFNGTSPDWRTGVGMGLRWKSPLGPLRFDLARGLNRPDSPFTIGIGLGVEF